MYLNFPKSHIYTFFAAIGLLLFAACHSNENKSIRLKTNSVTHHDFVYYEPDTTIMTGVLHQKLFYGPPGFGKDTAKDEKWPQAVIVLPKPVDVRMPDGVEDESGFNEPVDTLDMVQLVIDDPQMQKTIGASFGKKVILKGGLFGAANVYHFTPALLDVKQIVKIGD